MNRQLLVLGLGVIGSRSADQLAAAGENVTTWTRTPRGRTDETTDLAAAAAKADVVLCYLRDDIAVRETFAKILPHLGEKSAFLNHATIDPATTMWLAAQCAEHEIRFLDAPFTGSKDAASGGNLVYYVAGDRDLVEELDPLLDLTSRAVVYLGPPPAATIVKITTNHVTAAVVQAATEAAEIARRHGVSPEAWHEAAKLNGCYAPAIGMKLPTILEDDFSVHFSAENMLKDTRYSADLAAAVGIEAPANAVSIQQLSAAPSDQDFSAIYKKLPAQNVALPVCQLRLRGLDNERYLNGQVSNDVALATEDKSLFACVLDAKGRLQFFIEVRRDGDDLLVQAPADQKEVLWQRLDRYLIADDAEWSDDAHLNPEPWTSYNEVDRIWQKTPRWPLDLFPGIFPTEADLDDVAISYNKGCYLGQEVVSRMKRAKKVNRKLTLFQLSHPLVPKGSVLESGDGQEAGILTSVARHPQHGEIALGYLKRKFQDETTFSINHFVTATVVDKTTTL